MGEGGVCTSNDAEDQQPLLFNAITNSLQRAAIDSASENHTSYCWRWYMLAVVAVLNLASGMVRLFCLMPLWLLLSKLVICNELLVIYNTGSMGLFHTLF